MPTNTARKPKTHKKETEKDDGGGVAVAEPLAEDTASEDFSFEDLPPEFQSSLQKMIDNRAQEVVAKAMAGTQPSPTPFITREFSGQWNSGQVVAPGTVPPPGAQIIAKDNGTFELWPLPTAEQKHTMARMDTLKLVDEEYLKLIPTKEFPDKPRPKRLVVNAAWVRLFKHQRTWGDSCDVVRVGHDDKSKDDVISSKTPAFRFETHEEEEDE